MGLRPLAFVVHFYCYRRRAARTSRLYDDRSIAESAVPIYTPAEFLVAFAAIFSFGCLGLFPAENVCLKGREVGGGGGGITWWH